MKPKVFISSTIYDFKDLRSSLKYWIDQMGYEAVLSEYNDFNTTVDKTTYDNCLNEIKNCDYFILLIGSRAGGFYDRDKKITITMQEYNVAYELSQQGLIKIVPFIRRSVWDVREDRKSLDILIREEKQLELDNPKKELIINHSSKIVTQSRVIFDFINMVTKANEMKKALAENSSLPKNNWIFLFENFEDIIATLKTQMKLNQTLSEKVLLFNLKSELENNIASLYERKEQGLTLIPDIICDIYINLDNLATEKSRLISFDDFSTMFDFCLISGRCQPQTHFILQAVSNGTFINYEIKENDFISTNVHQACIVLYNTISQISNESYKKMFSALREELFSKISEASSLNSIKLGIATLMVLKMHRDYLNNIFFLSKFIRKSIIDNDYNKDIDFTNTTKSNTYRKIDVHSTILSEKELDLICKD